MSRTGRCPWSGMPCTCNDVEAMVNCENSHELTQHASASAVGIPILDADCIIEEEYGDFHAEQEIRFAPCDQEYYRN